MQAIVIHEWGGPEVLRPEQYPDPTPLAGHVVVELRASSVNWHDIIVRRVGRGFPLPRILGIDGAGIRRDTGEEVIIYPGLRWGSGEEAPGPDYEILGDIAHGTYAELVCVPEENVFRKPRALSWEEAAALPTAGITAYRALFARARLQHGETVLVLGAGGGVSTFAVSLAAAVGARVVVTSSSTDKLARAGQLGAQHGVLYTDDDWPQQVREITGGVDVVVDGVGSNLPDALACLRPGGRVAIFGASGGTTAKLDLPSLYFSHASILATSLGSPRDFAQLLASIERQEWRPVIDSIRPLDEVGDAHRRMEAREHFGKLVLSIP